MSNSTPTFAKLNNYNYKSWSGNMQAWLMSKELWMLVNNDEPCPDDSSKDSKLAWQKCAQKAAGELFLSVEPDQKSHFHGILSDPFAYGTPYATYTCPRSQEHDLTPMTASFPSGNNQMNLSNLFVPELMHPCKQFKIFIQLHSQGNGR